MNEIINSKELCSAIDILKPNQQLFEIRILGADRRKSLSGYFRSSASLLRALEKVDLRNTNVYITLNTLDDALYSRNQKDRFVNNAQSTSDTEVNRYQWLFVDLDPIRIAGVSSSDEELKKADELKETVKAYLSGRGFSAPIEAISGNGYHLLYRIDLPVNDETKDLVRACLEALSGRFDNAEVKIDTINHNPSRICKLYGTLAQKGANTPERPFRQSRIINAPNPIEITNTDMLEALAAEAKTEDRKAAPKQRRTSKDFNLREWLSTYGLTYREKPGRDCKILELDECPFDPSHKNGDSKIFEYTDGKIAFKCHHNSCRGKVWQDVREKFEPDAYDWKNDEERIDSGYQRHKKKQEQIPAEEPKKEKPKKIRKLKTAEALMAKDILDPKVFVGVGSELPLLVEGTCILSAKPKLGKSWFALAMCLAVAKGDDFLGYKTEKSSTLYLDLETSESIQKKRLLKALQGQDVPKNFYLETETEAIGDGFIEQIEAYMKEDPSIGVVVIDVFQIIRSPSKNFKESEYEHAYRDITPLNELAQRYHISIILVCHDRKAVDPEDPFSNILGSTGLQGAATQMIVMFKKKKDDPIHVSVKGKTIDGLPDLDVVLDNAQWSITERGNSDEKEKEIARMEYLSSDIRQAVITLATREGGWHGRCSSLINDAVDNNIPVTDTPKQVGSFLHRHQGRFLKEDHIKVEIISNGSGGKTYRFTVFTVDTVDATVDAPLMNWQRASKQEALEIPFT